MANFYVNLISGNDTTGDGSIGNPWATITKACGTGGAQTIGDQVFVTKTPGSPTLIGTATAANNSFTITTPSDYTGSLAVKDVISMDPSGFPYMQITAINSTTITVAQYPWFDAGTDTGTSTVNIYKVPFIDVNVTSSNNWAVVTTSTEIPNLRNTPFDYNTTYGFNIRISGGWNTDFTAQDGYTLIRNLAATAGFTTGTFFRSLTGCDGYKFEKFGCINFSTWFSPGLSVEGRIVTEDCILSYTSTFTNSFYAKNCRSYNGSSSYNFGSSAGGGTYVGNTLTETNVVRPMLENHTHFLSYNEYSITTNMNVSTSTRNYAGFRVLKNPVFKSALRTSDYVAGQSNVGKFPILMNASNITVINPTVTKNANITGQIMRIFNGGSSLNNSVIVDSTQLNSVTYSNVFSNLISRTYNYIESTNGDIFAIDGTFKTVNGGDNSGVVPYSNNIVKNADGTRYYWDQNFVSTVDSTVYATGSNSMKFTKITDYNTQQSGLFIGDVEIEPGESKTITVVCKGSKAINKFHISANYGVPIPIGGGFFVQSGNTGSPATGPYLYWFASPETTLSNSSWTTLTLTIPSNLYCFGSKIKLCAVVTSGTNMVNGDSIWIDSITVA